MFQFIIQYKPILKTGNIYNNQKIYLSESLNSLKSQKETKLSNRFQLKEKLVNK